MIEKIKKNYFVLIVTFLFLYFFFNLLDGERGLISLLKKKNLLSKLKFEEKQINNDIEIFVSDKNNSWTIIFTNSNKLSCGLVGGKQGLIFK